MSRYPIPKNNKKFYLSLKLMLTVKVIDKIMNYLKLTFRKILIRDSLNVQHAHRFRPGHEAARFETYESMVLLGISCLPQLRWIEFIACLHTLVSL
jgi:hypothetical protein